MKKWVIIIALFIALLLGGFIIIFKMAIPRAAQTFVPVKWQNIPLGQSKAVVHDYLGDPDTIFSGKDHWEQKLNSMKKYVLKIGYRGDTICSSYKISYDVDLFGIEEATLVKIDSIR